MRNARLQKEEKEGVLDKKSTFKGKGGGQDFFFSRRKARIWIRKSHLQRKWRKPVLIRAHHFNLEGLEINGLVGLSREHNAGE